MAERPATYRRPGLVRPGLPGSGGCSGPQPEPKPHPESGPGPLAVQCRTVGRQLGLPEHPRTSRSWTSPAGPKRRSRRRRGPSPTAKITAVRPVARRRLSAAYVVVLDTSGSMDDQQRCRSGRHTWHTAKSLAKAFVAGVGPDDLVKLVAFEGNHQSRVGRWRPAGSRGDPNLGGAIDQVHEARKTYAPGLVAAEIANGRLPATTGGRSS